MFVHSAPTDRSIIDKSTADDLKWIIRIIDKDLRIKIGPKFVLGGNTLASLVVGRVVSCVLRSRAMFSSSCPSFGTFTQRSTRMPSRPTGTRPTSKKS